MTQGGVSNIFQIYDARGHVPGFWVIRESWEATVAHVVEVGPVMGPPPYLGNPKVFADVYDVRSGVLRQTGTRLPTPGSYHWRLVDPPVWATSSS